ncbi:GGDEF domain-containing protein [Roseovarius nubinhibens]|uniref:GGDEF domain-containing protein n=1 Tax=Roseovarius nubinhibens TaxID=314263 RepID=UPI000320AB61|nr:GGDEF domain-containing protein [Roseovarius nubinhibens]
MPKTFDETLSRPPSGGIAQVAPDGRFQSVSAQLAHFLGYSVEALIGKGIDEITHTTDHLRECAQLELLQARGAGKFSLLKRFRHPERGLVWAEQLVLLMPQVEGRPPVFEVHVREPMVSDQTLNELHRRAFRDPLTGLLNRASISEQIDSAIMAGNRLGRSFALLLLDIDGFKQVNDTHGHLAGDAVMQQLGRRLNATMIERDLTGRLGGDEFVILLRSATDDFALKRGQRQVLRCFDAPFTLPKGGQADKIALGASLGMAAFPRDGCTVTGLLTRADHRMYEEKRSRLSA